MSNSSVENRSVPLHLLTQKDSFFQNRWDNGLVPKGEYRSKLIGLNDVYATLCDLVNITVPENQAIDSVSFAGHMYDENMETREILGAWTYDETSILRESVRFNEMKLIRHFRRNETELYNLTSDISETTDISAGNEDLIREMRNALNEFGPCYDKKGRIVVKIKPDGTPIRRNCQWFSKKKTYNRCTNHPLAQIHCRSACALKNKKYCTF